jgi:hypothetical protein
MGHKHHAKQHATLSKERCRLPPKRLRGSLPGAAVPQMLTCRWIRGEHEGGGNSSCARAASKPYRAGEADGHFSPVKQPRFALGGPHIKHCSAPPPLGWRPLSWVFSSSFRVNAASKTAGCDQFPGMTTTDHTCFACPDAETLRTTVLLRRAFLSCRGVVGRGRESERITIARGKYSPGS